VCLHSWLSYPACKAQLFSHLWPVRLCHIFPHYLINGTIFWKKLLNIKCVFWFYLQLLSETFLIIRRIKRDIIINVHRSSCKLPLFFSDFNKIWTFSTHFQKIPNITFHKNLSSGGRVVPCGRTDMTKLIVAFRNFANATEKDCSRKYMLPKKAHIRRRSWIIFRNITRC
jgi:hypothetical protein